MYRLSQLVSLRVFGPILFGIFSLVLGLAAGFWLGQTTLGQWFPRLFAIGTVLSFLASLYVSIDAGRITVDHKAAEAPLFFYLCLLLAALVLGSSVTAVPAWQLSSTDRVAGFIPYSDAQAYYRQVLDWPAAHFDAWNSRRPLNAALNILEFHLGGSTLLGMQFIRVGLAAVAISAFMAALAALVGATAALAAGFALLIWTWPHASSLLSEINGITMAAASFAVLLVALERQRRSLAFLGLFGLVLAYAFRPYNPLMPAIFAVATAWGLWGRGGGRPWKPAITMAMAAILLVVAVPKAIYAVYGDPEGSANANAASTILGLARGTDWKEASEFIAKEHSSLTERETAALMYRSSLAAVLNDPGPLLKAMLVSTAKFLFVFQQQMGATLGLPDTIDTNAKGDLSAFLGAVSKNPAIWFASLLTFGSLFLAFLLARREASAPLLAAAASISLISIAPIVFTDGGWRVVATLLPTVALLILSVPLALRHYSCVRVCRNTDGKFAVTDRGYKLHPAAIYPLGIMLFISMAIIYPQLSRFANSVQSERPQAVRVSIEETGAGVWTGLNEGRIMVDNITKWAKNAGDLELQAFFAQHGHDVRLMSYAHGKTVFYLDDPQVLADALSEYKAGSFTVAFLPVSDSNE